MSLDTLNSILISISELPKTKTYTIALAGRGEPALHENYAELLQMLLDFRQQHSNIKIDISTNGTRFDQYLKYYQHVDSMHYNVYYNHSDAEYLDIFKKYSRFKNIRVKRKDHQQAIKYYSWRVGQINNDMTVHEPDQLLESYCNKPFDSVFIDWNGNYNLCCEDWRPDLLVLSNIDKQSIIHYYTHNTLLQEYKQTLSQGQRIKEPCNNCNKRCSQAFIEKVQQHATQNTNSIS
jgi:hypothetical protein